MIGRQYTDSLGGERVDSDPRDPVAGTELAEEDAERMVAVDLIAAIGGDQESGEHVDPAGDDPEDVQRRLVGPVNILEDDDGDIALELLHQRRRQLVRPRRSGCDSLELAAGHAGDVEEGAQRTRREQRVAGAPEETPLVLRAAEPANERGLAHSGLPADEGEPAATGRGDRPEKVVEGFELLGALQQLAAPCGGRIHENNDADGGASSQPRTAPSDQDG